MSSFNILESNSNLPIEEANSIPGSKNALDRIKDLISENQILLFMKGNAQAPMCGFSANSCAILKKHSIIFKTYDILKDPEIRNSIKEFSNWPTFPQLYINGELVGGNDILTEIAQSGELKNILTKLK